MSKLEQNTKPPLALPWSLGFISPWSHQWLEVQANRLSFAILGISSFLLPHLFQLHLRVTSQWGVILIRPAYMFGLAPEAFKNTIPIWMSSGWVRTFQFNHNAHHSLWPRAAYFRSHLPSPRNHLNFQSEGHIDKPTGTWQLQNTCEFLRDHGPRHSNNTQPYHLLSSGLGQVWPLFPCLL